MEKNVVSTYFHVFPFIFEYWQLIHKINLCEFHANQMKMSVFRIIFDFINIDVPGIHDHFPSTSTNESKRTIRRRRRMAKMVGYCRHYYYFTSLV